MRRYAATFALFGFLAALTVGLFGEAPLDDVLESGLFWGVTFFVLGLALGWAGRALLDDVDLGPLQAAGETPESEERNEERASALAAELIARVGGNTAGFTEVAGHPVEEDKTPDPAPDERVR